MGELKKNIYIYSIRSLAEYQLLLLQPPRNVPNLPWLLSTVSKPGSELQLCGQLLPLSKTQNGISSDADFCSYKASVQHHHSESSMCQRQEVYYIYISWQKRSTSFVMSFPPDTVLSHYRKMVSTSISEPEVFGMRRHIGQTKRLRSNSH